MQAGRLLLGDGCRAEPHILRALHWHIPSSRCARFGIVIFVTHTKLQRHRLTIRVQMIRYLGCIWVYFVFHAQALCGLWFGVHKAAHTLNNPKSQMFYQLGRIWSPPNVQAEMCGKYTMTLCL